jgi:hypothetical protein
MHTNRKTDLTQLQVGNKNKVHQVPRGKLLGRCGAGCTLSDLFETVEEALEQLLT